MAHSSSNGGGPRAMAAPSRNGRAWRERRAAHPRTPNSYDSPPPAQLTTRVRGSVRHLYKRARVHALGVGRSRSSHAPASLRTCGCRNAVAPVWPNISAATAFPRPSTPRCGRRSYNVLTTSFPPSGGTCAVLRRYALYRVASRRPYFPQHHLTDTTIAVLDGTAAAAPGARARVACDG